MTPAKLLKDALNNKEVQAYLIKYNRRMERRDKYIHKMRELIAPMSNAEFLKFIDRICKWETVFEERYYKRGIETTSNVFDILFEAVSQKEYSRPCNEMFLSEKYIYKGLTFKMYQGQGVFFRITMGKRLLFQSS